MVATIGRPLGKARVGEPYGKAPQPRGHRDIGNVRMVRGHWGYWNVRHVCSISLCI